jgi:hypothetical protein
MRRVSGFLRRHKWVAALAWAGVIMSVSSIPRIDVVEPPFPGCDKFAHLIEYSILGVGLRFWAGGRAVSGTGLLVILAGIAFGAADEVHQRFIPGRVMSLVDFAADAAGVTLGFWFGRRLIPGRLLAGERPGGELPGSERPGLEEPGSDRSRLEQPGAEQPGPERLE